MDELAAELKAEAEGKQREGKPVRYRAELRSRAMAYLRERQRAGATLTAVSRELGIRCQTIQRWLAAAERKSRPESRAGFRPVTVGLGSASGPARWVRILGPCGIRVEGLSVAELRALSTP